MEFLQGRGIKTKIEKQQGSNLAKHQLKKEFIWKAKSYLSGVKERMDRPY